MTYRAVARLLEINRRQEVELCTTRSIIAVLIKKWDTKESLQEYVTKNTVGKWVKPGETWEHLNEEIEKHIVHRKKDLEDRIAVLEAQNDISEIKRLRKIAENVDSLDFMDRFRREF